MADSAPLFTVALNEDGLFVNEWLISKPQFDSANFRFITFLLFHPNEKLKFADVEVAGDLPVQSSKRLSHYLNELGFRGQLKSLFWPVSHNGFVMLRNPITVEVLERHYGSGVGERITVEDLLNPDFF